jgi:hypothetical protein
VLFLLLGCAELLTIEIEQTAVTVVESGTLLENLIGDLGFSGFVSMDLTDSEELANQGVEPGDITGAKLVLLQLTAADPADGDLSFLQSMSVNVEAPDVDAALVASQGSFPEGEAVVSFDLEDVDLTPYVVSQSLTIGTDVSAGRPSEDTTVEALLRVEIEASLQGARNQLD